MNSLENESACSASTTQTKRHRRAESRLSCESVDSDDDLASLKSLLQGSYKDSSLHEPNHSSKQLRSRGGYCGWLNIGIVMCIVSAFLLVQFNWGSENDASKPSIFSSPPSSLAKTSFIDKTPSIHANNGLPELSREMETKKGKSVFSLFDFKRDKLWDVNGPPVPLAETQISSSPTPRRGGDSAVDTTQDLNLEAEKAEGLPKDPAIPVHASEALQCRESVVNFVINATDGKDECDGLIKAFDKTCSNDDEGSPAKSAEDMHFRRQLHGKHFWRHKVRSHTLWDKFFGTPISIKWYAHVYQTMRTRDRLYKYIMKTIGYDDSSGLSFFAEDEVFKEWNDADYLVKNELVDTVQKEPRSNMYEQQCSIHERETMDRLQARELEAAPADEDRRSQSGAVSESAGNATAAPKVSVPAVSLQLPIKTGHHVSDKTMNDALLLQPGNKIIQEANETLSATAHKEAAQSKKVMADTADAVSAVLNDPSSVEARTCCASILNVYHELCSTDDEEAVSDTRLFFLVFVMACCGIVKSLIRHFKILWLPEAAGCIIVGVLSGYALDFFPHHDVSFDGNWFLRILVPPIIFEAALSIDKRSFNRHIVPIIIYAVGGTLVATFLTAVIVHYGTYAMSPWCTTIPYVEALTFGALISSIDPIAVLSVLNNMGMNDTDTIYVLIFGESLLNDGVAIVLFHTLVHFLDETLVIDREAIIAAAVHFFVVAFGSLLVGVASGMLSTVYYWIFYGCQTPLVEVLMFFCWALLPYYVCDGIGWSGIVAAVAVGFVMDLHIVGQKLVSEDRHHSGIDISENTATSFDSSDGRLKENGRNSRRSIFNRYGHLSTEARTHVGFVTEIIATGMETAIFAYLGFFLFSHRYHWDIVHMVVAILACCISRAIMIPSLGLVANSITRIQQNRASCRALTTTGANRKITHSPAGVIIDKNMQIALWFAGLRGAMSFALVEHIPLYDSFSGEGTRLKPELKAMTSACILFTVFILGGYTYYMMVNLGIAPSNRKQQVPDKYEVTALINKGRDPEDSMGENEFDVMSAQPTIAKAFRRKQSVPIQGDALMTV